VGLDGGVFDGRFVFAIVFARKRRMETNVESCPQEHDVYQGGWLSTACSIALLGAECVEQSSAIGSGVDTFAAVRTAVPNACPIEDTLSRSTAAG